jgi:hypothetical protein
MNGEGSLACTLAEMIFGTPACLTYKKRLPQGTQGFTGSNAKNARDRKGLRGMPYCLQSSDCFSNSFNVIGKHIALNPANRSGYVDGPDSGVTEIQPFTY